MTELILVALAALAIGALVGWLVAGRRHAGVTSDLAVATARAADLDLVRAARDAVEAERNDAHRELAAIRAQHGTASALADQLRIELAGVHAERNEAHTRLATLQAQADGFETRLAELREAKDLMSAQFGEVANKLLGDAQKAFLERADHRFRQSEETAGQNLKALLQPVSDRLQRYEEGVRKVEAERRDAFGLLTGQIEAMRNDAQRVASGAANIVNALRNAPKTRGNWGEQALRNVLENCGLSEHTDFDTQVSVADQTGKLLRPDAVVRVPGGKVLVIDAKVSINAFQDAVNATDDPARDLALKAHALAVRAHVTSLGDKAYWDQFKDTPEFVVMFVPGEHLLTAALDRDGELWDYAFKRRVLLATPTNLIAIARTVDAVWKQEKLAKNARDIALLGKQLYDRLALVGERLSKAGGSLNKAVDWFNEATKTFNGDLAVTGRRFKELNIETGSRELEEVVSVDKIVTHATTDKPLIGAVVSATDQD